tara:strand:- start:2028 stop:3191 length:1164 start_codon:yes stop_codon:yes gene_type:complete
MAIKADLKEKLNTWSSIIESVGNEVSRYAFFVHNNNETDQSLANDYLNIATDTAEVEELYKDVRSRYAEDNNSFMDPITAFDIINGIFWPTIGGSDAAMIDHPSDEKLNSMRGIPFQWIFFDDFINDRELRDKLIPGEPMTTSYRIGGEGNMTPDELSREIAVENNPIKRGYIALREVLASIREAQIRTNWSKADSKEALSLLFKSEQAAKLYWIHFGRKGVLGHPINTLRLYNPYLAYFNWTVGWNSGDRGIARHEIDQAVSSTLTEEFYNGEDNAERCMRLGSAFLTDSPESALAKAVNATNAAVTAQYKWLQAQKTNDKNKVYYEQWFQRFFKNPKSLVNMIIIINEIINIDSKKQFTHTLKCREKLTKLGVAYQSALKLNIGL